MNKQLKLLILTALFSALIIVLTSVGKVPIGNGYIHLGDSVIYLAACILPTPYACAAAGIGGALSDALSGYAIYIVPTLVIKALITLPFSSKSEYILTKRNALSVVLAGMISVAGYSATALLLYGWAGALVSMLGDSIQAVSSAVLFLAFAAALDRIKFKNTVWQVR